MDDDDDDDDAFSTFVSFVRYLTLGDTLAQLFLGRIDEESVFVSLIRVRIKFSKNFKIKKIYLLILLYISLNLIML